MPRVIVIGGGVAGVSCARALAELAPCSEILLLAGGSHVKAVRDYVKITSVLDDFGVEDVTLAAWILQQGLPNLRGVAGIVERIDCARRLVHVAGLAPLPFDKLCICTGAVPLIPIAHPRIFGLRDAESVEHLGERLRECRRAVLIGNGGIALGMAQEARGCELVWVIREDYIGSTFFDASASKFFIGAAPGQLRVAEAPPRDATFLQAPQRQLEQLPASATAGARGRLSHSAGPRDESPDEGSASIDTARAAERSAAAPSDSATLDAARAPACACCDETDASAHLAAAHAAAAFTERASATLTCAGPPAFEYTPSYAPLPRRESGGGSRRAPRRRAQGEASTSSSSSGSALQCTEMARCGGDAAGGALSAPQGALPAPKRRCLPGGAAVGPAWAAPLRRGMEGSQGGTAPAIGAALSSSFAPTVILERRRRIVALRCTASGRRWTLDEQGLAREEARPELIAAPAAGTGEERRGGSEGGGREAAGEGGPSPLPAGAAPWPLVVTLDDAFSYGCDALVFAIGVHAAAGGALLAAGGAPVSPWPLDAPPASLEALLLDAAPAEGGAFFSAAAGALLVNPRMQATGSPSIYAAGDAAAVVWPRLVRARRRRLGGDPPSAAALPPTWFQLRTWNQARTSALHAARSIAAALAGGALSLEDDGGVAFELFAHATRFLGRRVALLGLFNGQGLGGRYEDALKQLHVQRGGGERGGVVCASPSQPPPALAAPAAPAAGAAAAAAANDVEVQLRVSPGDEYAKLVLFRGVLVGALLVGETGLEETCENLILNQLPIPRGATPGGGGSDAREQPRINLLDPDVDIEDFFD